MARDKDKKRDKPATAAAQSQTSTPSLKDIVYRYLGIWGLLLLALGTFALGTLWWQWDHVKKLPGVHKAVCAYDMSDWTPKWRPPHADPSRFAVGVAHLEYDEGHKFEELLDEALGNFDTGTGIEPLQCDRTICLEGQPEEAKKKGHEKARKYLSESGAQVLVWGAVRGGNATRLYWTSSQSGNESKSAYQPKDFELPAVFQKDLIDILSLVIVTQRAEYAAREGHPITNQLAPFIRRVQQLTSKSAQQAGWDAGTRARVNFILADALLTFGDQKGDSNSLNEAVTAYNQALKEWTRERVPLDWAMTQNNLGNALWRLGERESGTERLEAAVAAYREALKERTRERVPLDWAMTQNNLGSALRTLGERRKDPALLCEALGDHAGAWEVFSSGAPHYASIAASAVNKDIVLLKQQFDQSKYERCLGAHRETLTRMGVLRD